MSEASDVMDRMSMHCAEWKLKIRQARMALRTAITDALLTAGYMTYCSPFDQSLRSNLLADWLTRCETANFDLEAAVSDSDLVRESSTRRLLVPDENFSVEGVIGVAELLPKLETSGVLNAGSRHNAALIYSCLFHRSLMQRWTLLIDPDKQAESCVGYLLEYASMSSRKLVRLFASVINTNYVINHISVDYTWKKCNPSGHTNV